MDFRRLFTLILLALPLVMAGPANDLAHAQYFGQNKVIYEKFDFRVLKTEHFDIYYYPEEERAINDLARMAERWYARHVRSLGYEPEGRQPLIMYASGQHFSQTNVVPGQVGEGTGGVTESLKRRVIMPFAGPLRETDHVLGHEMVHAFQYGLAGVRGGNAAINSPVNRLPLWFIEGMSEYLSLGPEDPQTAMWMRDAVKSEKELPRIGDLSSPKYFPYRWGQALMAYIGGRWGDNYIAALLVAAGGTGNINDAIRLVLKMEPDSLAADWHQALRETYQPLMNHLNPPVSYGRPLVTNTRKGGELNISPVLSPDGKQMIFFSERSLFAINLYLADAETGEILRTIVKTERDPHFSSLGFINSAGAWSPDGKKIVFAASVESDPSLTIVNIESGKREREITFDTLGEILNPTWSPDGQFVAFSALIGGYTDLFMYDLLNDTLHRLTADAYAEIHPSWSPDGTQLAFATDRFSTNLETLDIGRYEIGILRLETGLVSPVDVFRRGRVTNPQWSPDGRSLYVISDQDGIANIYRIHLATREVDRLTSLYTGVSGITATSPAISVAKNADRMVFSAFEAGNYNIYQMESLTEAGEVAQIVPEGRPGYPTESLSPAMLPPVDRDTLGLVQTLNDPYNGLPDEATFTDSKYSAGLSLDYISQPYMAVGSDALGVSLGGGVALYWSDMLANHQLATGIQLQTDGGFTDFGGVVGYLNSKRRLNWGGAIQQIPYTLVGYTLYDTTVNGIPAIAEGEYSYRQLNREVLGILSYPFSRVQRVELTAGFEHISFEQKVRTRTFEYFSGAQLTDVERDLPSLGDISMVTASGALVFDNAIYGATSPLLGQRYRVQVQPIIGTLDFHTLLLDYRRYEMPIRPFTIGFRALHYGRYGGDAEDSRMTPIFLGYQDLIRGYDAGSFEARECDGPECPRYSTLFGSRVAVTNLELRFPILGLLGLGGGFYGFLPLETGLFYDAGVAWTKGEDPSFINNGSRDIVRSYGVFGRINLLGYVILELDYVTPVDRPDKGAFWQFGISPGF